MEFSAFVINIVTETTEHVSLKLGITQRHTAVNNFSHLTCARPIRPKVVPKSAWLKISNSFGRLSVQSVKVVDPVGFVSKFVHFRFCF